MRENMDMLTPLVNGQLQLRLMMRMTLKKGLQQFVKMIVVTTLIKRGKKRRIYILKKQKIILMVLQLLKKKINSISLTVLDN